MEQKPKFTYKRTPEEREASKERAKAARLAKTAKKEGVVLRQVERAAKKARDFLIRRLKRRLVLMGRAEQQEAEAGQDKSGQQEEDAGTSDQQQESKKPKFEKGTKEGITKQLLVAQQSSVAMIMEQAAKDLGVQQVNQASQTQEGLTEKPVLDEPMRQFVAKALQQKCCKAELEEGHEKLGVLRAKNEKWEKRRTKFILKAEAKAEKDRRIAEGLDPPEEPREKVERPLTKKERRRIRVEAKGRLNKQTKSRVTRKEQEKKKRKKERKAQRLQRMAESPFKRKRESAGVQPQSAEQLHPSWAAKKQQRVSIDQTAPSKAKKVTFD